MPQVKGGGYWQRFDSGNVPTETHVLRVVLAAVVIHLMKRTVTTVNTSSSLSARIVKTIWFCWLGAACIANFAPARDLGPVHTAAVWFYVVPLGVVSYVIPTLLPSIILPEAAAQSYHTELAKFGGLEITSGLAVDNVVDWFPEDVRRGAHLPAPLRGIFWMDGNGGCQGTGASDIASLGAGEWDPDSRVLLLPLYAPYTLSHHPANLADVLRAYGLRSTFVFHFDESLHSADITLRVFGVDLPMGSSWGSVTMRVTGPLADPGTKLLVAMVNESGWIYYLRRLVNESGVLEQPTLEAFKQAYTPADGPDESVQGFGATMGICTNENQMLRTR